jgi:hypothetical protein
LQLLVLVFCLSAAASISGATGLRQRHASSEAHAVPAANDQKTARAQFDRTMLSLLRRVVIKMERKREYVDGRFHPRYQCWWCGDQMGAVAAILARQHPAGQFTQIAKRSLNAGLGHQNPNGSFGPPTNGYELATATEAISLGVGYLEMHNQLSRTMAARWRLAIKRADSWLMGTINFYVNGNINLQVTTALYTGYRVLHDRTFLSAYDHSLAFTLAPGSKWPGYGLHYTIHPTNPLGTNGAGYLGEQGLTGKPGFDPHYTMLQADYATELYLLSGQPKILRLANLLMNQLFTRIDRRSLIIQTGDGSRHPQPNVSGRFEANVLPVLAFADRPNLLPLAQKQLQQVGVDFVNYVDADNDQDQVISNYAMTLIGLQAPALTTSAP